MQYFLLRSPLFRFATNSKYTIKQLTYLIEAEPARPITTYARYIKQETTGKKCKDFGKTSQTLSERWKKSPEVKEKLEKEYSAERSDWEKVYAEYAKKYVEPFKSISYVTLFTKKVHAQGKIVKTPGQGIGGIGGQSSKLLKALSIPEEDALKAEAAKIAEERKKIKETFKFPPKLYKTLRSYSLKFSEPNQTKTEQQKLELAAAYEKYLIDWKSSVEKWLKDNKYELTVEQFLELYDSEVKKEVKTKAKAKKEKEEKEEKTSDSSDF